MDKKMKPTIFLCAADLDPQALTVKATESGKTSKSQWHL